MKIVIFGGSGFIGTNISLEARKRGYEVIVFDSLIRRGVEQNVKILEDAGVTVLRGDVRNPEDFWKLPTYLNGVINLAANPGIPWSIENPIFDFNTNARGALNVLEYARSNGKVPVILASTNKVYSDLINEAPVKKVGYRYEWNQPREGWIEGMSNNGIAEEFPTDGYGKYSHSPYGASKLSADTYHQEYFHLYQVPVVINRMSCIYGYYQQGVADQGWIDHFVRQAFTKNPTLDIYGDGKQVRDMLWGGDVARLYLDELEHIEEIKGQIFNVGGGVDNTLSLLESISYIESISGKKFKINTHDWRHADQKIYISDTKKVRERIGWNPTVSPQQGIKKMFDKYKEVNKA
jgi:CDP-paratose 2-epimerase